MSNSFKEAVADLRKANADLDRNRAEKSAASRFDFQNADSNAFARSKAERGSWTSTRFMGHARRRAR